MESLPGCFGLLVPQKVVDVDIQKYFPMFRILLMSPIIEREPFHRVLSVTCNISIRGCIEVAAGMRDILAGLSEGSAYGEESANVYFFIFSLVKSHTRGMS